MKDISKIRTAILLEVCQKTGNRGDAAGKAFDAAIELASRLQNDSAIGELLRRAKELSPSDVVSLQRSHSIKVISLGHALEEYLTSEGLLTRNDEGGHG
jgi:hypothetical protein